MCSHEQNRYYSEAIGSPTCIYFMIRLDHTWNIVNGDTYVYRFIFNHKFKCFILWVKYLTTFLDFFSSESLNCAPFPHRVFLREQSTKLCTNQPKRGGVNCAMFLVALTQSVRGRGYSLLLKLHEKEEGVECKQNKWNL